MKIVLSVLLAMALSTAALAQSQDQSGSQGQSGSQPQGSRSQGGQMQSGSSNSSAQNMSGTVSHSGTNFTNDKNSHKYKVDNPETLKGREDQHVALVVQVDPDNNVIHVVQIEPPQ
jgi:Flp pilus assembly protein TadD